MTPFRSGVTLLIFAASPLVLQAQAPPAAATWTIPGIANVAGQNNTHFVSDVAVTNPGSTLVPVFLSFVPSGAYPSVPVFLAPGQTMVWKNVLQQLWGASVSGALKVTSSGSPLLIRARTYNDAASGTFGVALPVYTDDRFLQEGAAGHSLWVSQSPDPAKGYRTNISVIFPDSGGGTATVTVYDGDGSQIGQQDFTLGAAGVMQLGVGKFAAAANVARATIEVKSGRAAGYSAVVDNLTGDSSLFTFDDLPAGPQDVLANGVARSNGKNNTFFRTDGRFFNPGDTDVTVTAAFHASGNSNPSPVTRNFNVPAGKILDVTDLLGTLLGVPVGSAGAVRFTSSDPVGILCRTSNVDPTGASPGTYGSQQKPVQLLSILSSADAGAVITGVRQNASYRTNIAMASGRDGATAQFTLKSAQGATVGTATQTLGAFGWWQSAVDKLFGVGIPDDAEVDVKLTQGSADVYDSSVDNSSGDSVVTPAPGLPISIPTSATIGPAGGSVRSDDGRLTLKIPAGALSSATNFSIATGANGAPNGLGSGYAISPAGLVFAQRALLVFHYAGTDVDGSAPDDLGLAYPSGSTWHAVLGGTVSTGDHTLAVPLAGTSGAASTARRNILVSAAPWGPYASAVVTANPRGLFVNATSQVQVFPVGNSSTAPPGSDDELLAHPGLTYEWSLWPSPGGGSLSVSGATDDRPTYKAPSCLPGTNPVVVSVKILKQGFRGRVIALTTISIFPRNWVFAVDDVTHVDCIQVANARISYAYGSTGGEWAFSLDDDGNLVNFRQQTPPSRDFSSLTFCGTAPPYCSFSMDDTFELGFLENVTGRLNPNTGSLEISGVHQLTEEPAIKWHCVPGGDGEKPADPGLAAPFGPLKIGPQGGLHLTGGEVSYTKWRLKPTDPTCGP